MLGSEMEREKRQKEERREENEEEEGRMLGKVSGMVNEEYIKKREEKGEA